MFSLENLSQGKWWVLLLRGILAIILGLIALYNIRGAVMVLYLFLGYYFLLDALLQFSQAWFHYKSGEDLKPPLISGLISLGIGLFVFIFPSATVRIFIALIATYAIVQGVTDIYTAFRYPDEYKPRWRCLTILGGFAQIVFALWIIFQPIMGGLTLVVVIGIYALVVGVILILRAFQVRAGGPPGSVASA